MVTNNNDKKKEGRNIPFMDDKKYFDERLDEQIAYYEKKASENKVKYKYYKRLEFALASSIPVVIGLSSMGVSEGATIFSIEGATSNTYYFTVATLLQVLAALSGIVLAFINKIIELDDYYRTWKDYRLTHELLYNQKILYLTKSEPYDEDEESFTLFVRNIEGILTKEVQKWSVVKQDDNKLSKSAQDSLNSMFKKFSDSNASVSSISETAKEIVNVEKVEVEEKKIEPKVETKPEVKTETKVETKAEVKTETKVEEKVETTVVSETAIKPENEEEIFG